MLMELVVLLFGLILLVFVSFQYFFLKIKFYFYLIHHLEVKRVSSIPATFSSWNFLTAPDITLFDFQKESVKKCGKIFRWTGGPFTIVGIS